MTQTPNLNLPYLLPAQSLKYITYNEAMARLDSLAQLSAKSHQSAPPAQPQSGDTYLVGAQATGEWEGFDTSIARYEETGHWYMLTPKEGWTCLILDERRLYSFYGASWAETQSGPETAERFGINGHADTFNRFVVKSDAALFDNEGQDHMLKINKASKPNTASLQFQTAYQSYGEIGLAGNNDVTVKVSSDAVNWTEAMIVETSTGHTKFQNLYSGEVYLLNNTAKTITPPKSGGFMMIMIDDEVYPQLSHSAIIAYDVGSSPNVLILGSGTKFNVVNNEVLTGTKGPEQHTTLSALNGSLMIENRYGTHQTYRYTFLG